MSGRIPEAFIHDLLQRSDIVDVVGARVELKRAGSEYKGRSPFTNEKTPSFFVNPAKQMFFDFSSGKNGTVISFLMEFDRLSFVEAVEELAEKLGLEVPREGGASMRPVLDGPLDALATAERFFKEQLKKSEAAKDYLIGRGVNGETAKLYGIGYAPESWDALTRQFRDPRHALAAGLLIEREGEVNAEQPHCYDRFRNRVMFPIRDSRGRPIGFGGRTLANDPAKYLNSPETALFHKGRNLYGLFEAKQSSKAALPQLVVVEGYMDVVMLAQAGVREVVATLGTATTAEHLHLLFKHTGTVVFCFDGDRAGRAAAWRALEQALPVLEGTRECRFLFLPDGQDPDSHVQQVGGEAFRAQLAGAQPLVEFLLAELSAQADLATLDGRAKLAELARPHLAKIKEGPLRALLVDELSRLTRLRPERLDTLLPSADGAAPAVSESTRSEAAAPSRTARTDPAAKLARRALRLLLEAPAYAAKIGHLSQLGALDNPAAHALLEAIEFFQEHPGASSAALAERWRDTPTGEALSRLLGEPVAVDGTALARELSRTLQQLRERSLKASIAALLGENEVPSAAQLSEAQALQAELTALKAG